MIELDFSRMRGVMPVVLQDAESESVLSVGFMNRAALMATLETGKVILLSRRSGRLLVTHSASGEPAIVREVRADCDRDSLLVRVHVDGEGLICEQGTFTCFTEGIPLNNDRHITSP